MGLRRTMHQHRQDVNEKQRPKFSASAQHSIAVVNSRLPPFDWRGLLVQLNAQHPWRLF